MSYFLNRQGDACMMPTNKKTVFVEVDANPKLEYRLNYYTSSIPRVGEQVYFLPNGITYPHSELMRYEVANIINSISPNNPTHIRLVLRRV